jgi:hypothetical protein
MGRQLIVPMALIVLLYHGGVGRFPRLALIAAAGVASARAGFGRLGHAPGRLPVPTSPLLYRTRVAKKQFEHNEPGKAHSPRGEDDQLP